MGGRKVSRATRAPAFGIAILTPVLLAGAVAASPDRPSAPVSVAAPSAAPQPAPAVVAPAAVAAPVAGLRIPAAALSAYRKAEAIMATADPGCGLSWNLLAGIGRLEPTPASAEPSAVRAVSARTPAPKKAPSATWLRFAADGDGDGRSDPSNPFDATLATARHLCSSGMNFRNQAQALTALMRYNDSMPFAQNVLGWAAAYATGTAPLNLPKIYGPVPVLGPYLPGIWGLTQATLVSSTQAGYLLPGAAAVAPNSVLPEQAPLPPVVVPELPTWVEPDAAAGVPAPVNAADTRSAAVAPQLALQGDRPRTEQAESYPAPTYTAPAPAPDPAPAPAPAPAPDPAPAPAPAPPPAPVLDLVPEAPAQTRVTGNGGGRQSGRTQIDSAPQAPQVPTQSAGTGDRGGSKNAGGGRRGARGD
jgi:hypothetical protein